MHECAFFLQFLVLVGKVPEKLADPFLTTATWSYFFISSTTSKTEKQEQQRLNSPLPGFIIWPFLTQVWGYPVNKKKDTPQTKQMKTKRFFFLSQAPTRSSLKQTTWARRLMWRHEALHLWERTLFVRGKKPENVCWRTTTSSGLRRTDPNTWSVMVTTWWSRPLQMTFQSEETVWSVWKQHECSIRRMYTVAPDGLSQPGCASEREKHELWDFEIKVPQ